MNLMIDLETLSTQPNAVVLSIGAVLFDENDIHGTFYATCSAKYQTNRDINHETVFWWMNQSDDAKDLFKTNAIYTGNGLTDLLNWLYIEKRLKQEKIKLWGNGSDFDNVILNDYLVENYFEPFKHHNNRCFRTIKNILPLADNEKPMRQGVHHNALDDAIYQTHYLQAICKKYGVKL